MHWSPVHPLSFITFTNVILRKGFELLLKILFIFFESWNVKFHSPHGPTCFLSRQESRFSRHDTFMSIAVLLRTHFLCSNKILRTFHNNKNLIFNNSYYAKLLCCDGFHHSKERKRSKQNCHAIFEFYAMKIGYVGFQNR